MKSCALALLAVALIASPCALPSWAAEATGPELEPAPPVTQTIPMPQPEQQAAQPPDDADETRPRPGVGGAQPSSRMMPPPPRPGGPADR